MGIKNFLINIGILVSLLISYFGIILILQVSSPTFVSSKISYLEKAKAELFFYQGTRIVDETNQENVNYDTVRGPTYWTSQNFTQDKDTGTFNTVIVGYNTPPGPQTLPILPVFIPCTSCGGGPGGDSDH